MPSIGYRSDAERMGQAQMLEAISRGRSNNRRRSKQLSGYDHKPPCLCDPRYPTWANRMGVALTYDDWGDGPMCVMCGEIKNEST